MVQDELCNRCWLRGEMTNTVSITPGSEDGQHLSSCSAFLYWGLNTQTLCDGSSQSCFLSFPMRQLGIELRALKRT